MYIYHMIYIWFTNFQSLFVQRKLWRLDGPCWQYSDGMWPWRLRFLERSFSPQKRWFRCFPSPDMNQIWTYFIMFIYVYDSWLSMTLWSTIACYFLCLSWFFPLKWLSQALKIVKKLQVAKRGQHTPSLQRCTAELEAFIKRVRFLGWSVFSHSVAHIVSGHLKEFLARQLWCTRRSEWQEWWEWWWWWWWYSKKGA